MKYVQKNFAITKEPLGEIDNSSEEFCLIKINPPWDTYFQHVSSLAIEGLYLGIYLNGSQVFLLIDTGEDMVKTDDWYPSDNEIQTIKAYVEDFYEKDNSESELLRECV